MYRGRIWWSCDRCRGVEGRLEMGRNLEGQKAEAKL